MVHSMKLCISSINPFKQRTGLILKHYYTSNYTHMYIIYITCIQLPAIWQNTDGLSNAMSRRSCVQYNLSWPPRYEISITQAMHEEHSYIRLIQL